MIDLQLRWHSHGRRGEKSKDKDERLHFGYGNMRIVLSFMILYSGIEKGFSEDGELFTVLASFLYSNYVLL